MKVIAPGDVEIDLGITEVTPTIGIIDFSKRSTDDFGVTTVVPRAFQRRMSVKFALPSSEVDAVQLALADLRATPAQWVASEDFAWLNFEGFYKDFSLDVAAGEKSFCSLTVEGLAETEVVTDAGEDPAPTGASTFMLVQPVTISGAALISSDVPETDYAEWNGATIYGLNARVIKAATHRIYESAAANNLANDPAGLSGVWIDVGPTNRWAMFDEALGTVTSRNGGMAVTLAPGAVDAVALLDVIGATVRVQKGAYDETKAVSGGAVTFLDLPGAAANITITVAGTGTVSVGTLLVGKLVTLGITEENPSAGITDFSRKEVDDFGDATIVERAWAKRFTANALISTAAVDIVANRIAAVRARPSLWIGADGTDALTVYGFFKDFSIEVGQNVSKLAVSIEGLSKAAPPAPALAPSSPPTNISPVAPLELPEGTLWVAPDGHPYRFGSRPWTSNGAAWTSNGEAWLGGGYTDVQDQLGVLAAQVAAAVTAQVARIASDNWLTAGEKSGLVLSHKAMIENHIALNAKAVAIGAAPTERAAATAAINALNAYLASLTPAWNDTTQDTPATAATLTGLWGTASQTVAALQAAIQGLPGPAGTPGVDGVDGVGVEFVWKRAATIPATPTGNGIPATWSDDPPAGDDPLWMSKAKQELDGTLVAGETWSTPVRQDGEAALDLSAAPASLVIPANSLGVPVSGALPKTVQMAAQLAGADVTGAVTWPDATVTNCAVTNLGAGAYRVDTITDEAASFTVSITHAGQTTLRTVTLAKARAGNDAQRAQTGSFGTPGPSFGVAAGSTITLNVFPSTTITLSASASYDASTAGSCRIIGRLMYRNVTDGGSWTQAGSDINGSYANNTGGSEPVLTPGAMGGSATVSAPASLKSYEFRLEWVKDGFATIFVAASSFAVSIS